MFTIAYSSRSRDGWSDENGNLSDSVSVVSSDCNYLESLCNDLNNRFGRSFQITDDYLEFYVEEINDNVD